MTVLSSASVSLEHRSFLDPRNKHVNEDVLSYISLFLGPEAERKHVRFEELRGRAVSLEDRGDLYSRWDGILRENACIIPHLPISKMTRTLLEAFTYKNINEGRCELRKLLEGEGSTDSLKTTFSRRHILELKTPVTVDGTKFDVVHVNLEDSRNIRINFFVSGRGRSEMQKQFVGNFAGEGILAQVDSRGYLFVATSSSLNVIDLRGGLNALYSLDLKVDAIGLDSKGFLRVHSKNKKKDVVQILDFSNPKAPVASRVSVLPPPPPPPAIASAPAPTPARRIFAAISFCRPLLNLAEKVAYVALVALAVVAVVLTVCAVGFLAFKAIQLGSVVGAVAATGLWISARL